jgi:hypothetical protein
MNIYKYKYIRAAVAATASVFAVMALTQLSSASVAAVENPCQPARPTDPPETTEHIKTEYFCDAAGRVRKRVERFVSSGTESTEIIYDESERRQSLRIWDSERRQTGELSYIHLDDGSFIETSHQVRPAPGAGIDGQRQYKAKGPEGKPLMIREWFYPEPDKDKDKDKNENENENENGGGSQRRLTHSDSYWYTPKGHKKIAGRELYDDKENISLHIAFEYDPGESEPERPVAFQARDMNGRLVKSYSRNRTLSEALDLRAIYRNAGESDAQIDDRLRRRDRPRLAVAVIDSGFDVFHTLLADKMWVNPLEKARKLEPGQVKPGESADEAYLKRLKALWRSRKI